MESINSNSTSLTEARMVVVRSVKICTLTADGNDACSCGSSFLMRSTTLDDIRARLPLDIHDHRRRLGSSMPPADCFRCHR